MCASWKGEQKINFIFQKEELHKTIAWVIELDLPLFNTQYTTQFVQTNVDERKLTKTRMLQNNFSLCQNWTNKKIQRQ